MWIFLLTLSSILVGVSSSPYIAIMGLVFISLALSLKIGIGFSSWFFFTLAVVYVGGMMVMFIYLSSLIQSAKLTLVGAWGGPLLGGLAGLSGGLGLLAPPTGWEGVTWVATSFSLSSAPLAGVGALYLLGALVSVYRLCQKGEGPMKSR